MAGSLMDAELAELNADLSAANVDDATRARILRREAKTIEVLKCNVTAVRVFQLCHLEVQVGLDGAHWIGVRSTEVAVVAETCGVPCDAELLISVRILAAAYSKVQNQRRAAASHRG